MATKVENEKGFLVLKVDKQDFDNIGSPGICDFCNKFMKEGYYIAALNSIYCEECYEDWLTYATRYMSDIHIEERRYAIYEKAFNGSGDNFHIQ